MVVHGSQSQTPRNEPPSGSIDPYVLFEALTGRKFEKTTLPSRSFCEEYDDLSDIKDDNERKNRELKPDPKPKDVTVGAINPFALTENLIGHKIDRHSMAAIRIIEDTLQTDYEELFDLRHGSVLYAGLKLNYKDRVAEELNEKEIKILKERDLVTPDLSNLVRLNDLNDIGLKEMGDTRIKRAAIQNGKLHLVLHASSVARTVCNREVTQTMNDFSLPFRRNGREGTSFTPPNSTWRDATEVILRNMPRRMTSNYNNTFFDYGDNRDYFNNQRGLHMRRFDDPVQGATANSWFISALFSVFWADPASINRFTQTPNTHMGGDNENRRQRFHVKFHDKGGRNNSKTETIEVDYQVPVNNSSEDLVYCRSSDGLAIWPSLYEKAFTKWITAAESNRSNDAERVDITQTHHGDPVKAMAQINGREPEYWQTRLHEARDIVGVVRSHSVNHRTIVPMAAWTYATRRDIRENRDGRDGDDRDNNSSEQDRELNMTGGHDVYRGSNLVANHAYSVLGWSSVGQGDKQYIIVRNPFGVTEPHGLTSYPGVLTRVEPEYWRPASLLDQDGVMAIEAHAFREYFAYIGAAR
ncbi:hypothetical protein GGR57DRAFT_513413 [Xylariaceae sp. FL1272]|nr:hypothetical protein GGR57DRAFT_513413 [Xylariaceae sp. FL1272]